MVTKTKVANFTDRLLPVLLIVSIGLAFIVGMLWQRVSTLEGGGTTTTKQATGTAAPAAAPAKNGKLTADQAKKVPAVSAQDHIKGSTDADIVLVEYTDYECPFCKQFHPTAQKAVDDYNGKVAWVIRDYPLDFHPKARPSAEAAECVAEIGGEDAFWAFTDAAYTGAPASLNDLVALATGAGVSESAFNTCVTNGTTKDEVQADYDGGATAGITGTPGTFVINKKGEVWLVPGALPFESLKATIDEALAS